jgi:hypothetical protein
MKRPTKIVLGLFFAGSLATISPTFAQVSDDIQVGGETERPPEAPPPGQPGQLPPGLAPPGAPGEPGQVEPEVPERPVTVKEGWQKKGPSRIYDAFDGRLIVNDVSVSPFRLTKNEARRKYDNGLSGDEVPRDGLPSRVLINDTDYIGDRTAANYDELKGILFNIGTHRDGPQRFFNEVMVSLDWDGADITWDPDSKVENGVYRLTSLEKRMFAFIIRDSLEIMRSYQNAEGRDLQYFQDKVDPPTGLSDNSQQSTRPDSRGIEAWNRAISTGEKVRLERGMLAALAGTEVEDASWFPGGISAVQLSRLGGGGPAAGNLTGLGLGGAGFGVGLPGAGFYGGGGYGAGAGIRPGAGLIPGGVPPVPMGGYGNLGGGISPLGGSLGFAF